MPTSPHPSPPQGDYWIRISRERGPAVVFKISVGFYALFETTVLWLIIEEITSWPLQDKCACVVLSRARLLAPSWTVAL